MILAQVAQQLQDDSYLLGAMNCIATQIIKDLGVCPCETGDVPWLGMEEVP